MNAKKENITHLFFDAATKFPNKSAIIEGDRYITYDELADEVKKTAAYFWDQGIRPGDRVLVFVPMSIELYRVVLALFYIGASAVFLDEWVSKERLLLCCRIADCKAFIGTTKARVLCFFAKEIRKIPIKLSLKKRSSRNIASVEVNQEATALITFTTGSTGIPKAADRSHRFLTDQFLILKEKIKTDPSDVDMPVLPIFLFINLAVGCTSVIAKFNSRKPQSLNPKVIIDQIQLHQVNRIIASPFFIRTLSEYMIEQDVRLSTIRNIFTGGAPVFPKEALVYCKALPDAEVLIVYGSTEAEPISSISAEAIVEDPLLLHKGLPVGEIHPKTQLKIINMTSEDIPSIENFDDLDLDEEKVGEIIVAGEHVLKKYFNNPRAFAANKIISNGETWHRTGDSGFVKNGKLFLTGRCKQLIFNNGEIISPFIEESKLLSIDGISMGTFMSCRNQLMLIVESKLSKERIKELVSTFTFDHLKVLSQIPRDPRHFSKIDYARLATMI